MTKFMNAELINIRDNLVCGHCSSVFIGSDSQAWKVKYEKGIVYCSKICRAAAMKNKLSKPIPSNICQHCNKEFFSRTSKQFCGMSCYTKSEKMKTHIDVMQKKSKGFGIMSDETRQIISDKNKARAELSRVTVSCLDCGKEINKIKS